MSAFSFEDAVADCRDALFDFHVPHAFIGGVAVLSYGVARATVDVDATLAGAEVDVAKLVVHLASAGFDPRVEDPVGFARRSNVLLMRHRLSGVPIDLTLGWLPFEHDLLQTTQERAFGGVRIPVPELTDLVIMKLVAHRPKDIADVEALAALHSIDFARARKTVAEFCEVLEDESRLNTLDRIAADMRR